MAEHTNRLVHESSPYLRQHAHNPVDWYPWGDEAFEKAKRENKPILLSVGYSACHWCHVMEHESFENAEIARLMNENFVSIKVDREERPDVDHIYMSAVQMLTGRGGWPMTVFLLPDRRPFYGGTYYPPVDRHGMPGFPRVLLSIASAYRDRPADVQHTVEELMSGLRRLEGPPPSSDLPDSSLVLDAAASLARSYDPDHGGLGQAPKFPNTSAFELFLRAWRATGNANDLEMVVHTLRSMANGGIYDQLGGAFHRYSVDDHWLVPHFEKMLYDNAQLVPLYLSAFQATGNEHFARIARETLDYVLREMRDPEGGFYSTQDADSDGEEGKFFVWERAEVERLLDPQAAEIACRYWDVTDVGNFEHRNILHITLEIDQMAKLFQSEPHELARLLEDARAKLFAEREKRVKPGRDEKILTSWNGLMVGAFAKGAEILGDERYAEAALDAVRFVEQRLLRGDRLLSTYKDGVAKLNGYLDDYAFFATALVDVFEAVQDRRHLELAARLTDALIAHFWDTEGGGFFFTSDDHEALIVRTKPLFDGSIPSGNSVALPLLLRLYHHTGRAEYLDRAETMLRIFGAAMRQQAFGFANMICAADFYTSGAKEIVVVAPPADTETAELLRRIRAAYVPNRTLTVVDPADAAALPPGSPIAGKGMVDGKPTVYVCHRMTCSPPATSWRDVAALLGAR